MFARNCAGEWRNRPVPPKRRAVPQGALLHLHTANFPMNPEPPHRATSHSA
jgi:hypothetical protein